METILIIIMLLAIMYLIRTLVVYSWMQQWNYFIRKHHIDMLDQVIADPFGTRSISGVSVFKRSNIVSEKELWKIIVNPLKVRPKYFFSYKPAFQVIHEKYLKN